MFLKAVRDEMRVFIITNFYQFIHLTILRHNNQLLYIFIRSNCKFCENFSTLIHYVQTECCKPLQCYYVVANTFLVSNKEPISVRS